MSIVDDWTKHWKSQWERHEETYKVGGALLFFGPSAAGAYQKVVEQNELARKTEANKTALKAMSQDPLQLSATGEFQITEGVKQWIPILLVFLLVGYLIFKD